MPNQKLVSAQKRGLNGDGINPLLWFSK